MNDAKETPVDLYLNVIEPVSKDLKRLRYCIMMGDARVAYFRNFEMSLSMICHDEPLYSTEWYQELEKCDPLPDDPDAYIPYETCRTYIMQYENILRKMNMIDKNHVVEMQKPQRTLIRRGTRI